jgi:hypothetical protein
MKRWLVLFLISLLGSACQPQVAPTATALSNARIVPAAEPTHAGSMAGTPTARSTPTSAVHSSSTDPNPANLIVVKDQYILHDSVTLQTVVSAQAAWIVLYFDSSAKSAHVEFGPRIVYDRIPAGGSSDLVVSFTQNLNPAINPSNLRQGGHLIDVVIQTDPMNSNSMVRDGGKLVWVRFLTLGQNSACTACVFPTSTP